MFGMLCYKKQEFTVSEMCELVAKLVRKLKAIHDGNRKHCRDPKQGYQATMNDSIEATRNSARSESKGPFEVTEASLDKVVAVAIWEAGALGALPKLLRSVSEKMKLLLTTLGVEGQDMSPFFIGRYHGNITEDLKVPFVSYMPSKTSPTSLQEEEKKKRMSKQGLLMMQMMTLLLATKFFTNC